MTTAPVKMSAECQALHGDQPPADESFVLNTNDTLRYAFVYIKGGVTGNYPPLSEPVELGQLHCTYTPHVIGVQAGQPIDIKTAMTYFTMCGQSRKTTSRSILFRQ